MSDGSSGERALTMIEKAAIERIEINMVILV
jgi:hypothetical protein